MRLTATLVAQKGHTLTPLLEALDQESPNFRHQAIRFHEVKSLPHLFGSGERRIKRVEIVFERDMSEYSDEENQAFADYAFPEIMRLADRFGSSFKIVVDRD